MKYQKLLFLILISFTFEFRSYEFIRKLQAEVGTDVINTELEPETSEFETIEPTTTPETTIPYVIPDHQEDTTVPVVEPGGSGGSGGPGSPDQPTTGPGGDSPFPSHNDTETQIPSTSPVAATTNPNVLPIPGHENDPITTIPSVISQPTYDPIKTEPSLLLLVGVGNFQMPRKQPTVVVEQVVVFEIYYKRVFGVTVPAVRMYTYIKVTYIILRSLQEGEVKTEEREERAVCDRITFDEDPNIRYNCSFPVEEDAELAKVTMDPSTPPTFEGMSESIAPTIAVSSLANETMSEKGIQTATGNELLRTQYLMNNTVLEENGLRFKLTGEMDSYLPDNNVILSFDEKGNGKIKNASCNANYLQGTIYELDCLAEIGINAHLNAVNGITTNSGEKVVIYMKSGTDEVLNAGSNSMGLYNRQSSSGLSGGAIAGIAIACVIAIISIPILLMVCRKSTTAAPFQETAIVFNSNNTTD